MLEINQIYQGDCLELMKELDDKSIDLILSDIPYGSTACEWDTIIPLELLWKQYKRIIKDNGAVVLTASQPFTTDLINSNRKWFKYEWIWRKEQGINQMLKNIAPLKIHENILVFGKGKVKYIPQMVKVRHIVTKRKGVIDKITNTDLKDYIYNNQGKNYPTSIIYAARELLNRHHPTQKPVALFEYLIKTYTNEGDLVLDSCIGSGTTAIAAIKTNRNYIGMELLQKYVDIANERIERELKQPRLKL